MEDEQHVEAATGSLGRGLALLEILSAQPTGVTHLARAMNMSKGGVHRLLQILRKGGWIRQAQDGTYECTLRIWEVGVRLLERGGLQTAAMPHLQRLWKETQETSYLAILDGSDALYILKINSPKRVLASFRVGDRLSAAKVAAGRVLLAHGHWEGLLTEDGKKLESTRQELLLRDFAGIREVGYAVNNGEFDETINGVAAPVFDSSGSVVAAIGFSCPRERFSEDSLTENIGMVVDVARDLSRDLGHVYGQKF